MQEYNRWSFHDHLREVMRTEWISASATRLSKDENAYSVGDSDGKIYFIEEGQVKIVSYSRDGKRCLLAVCVAGESFGELGILPCPRGETATAMTNTVLRRMSAARFKQALQKADLAEEFAMHLVGRLSEQQRVITNMVTMNCEQRLAATLLELARKMGIRQGNQLRIDHPITHEDLSAMVGTTRSRIGVFLKRFRDNGLVVPHRSASFAIDEPQMQQYVEAV
ncbi:Crp/Fnr family transcriptional regulator [Catellatospora vulcania]|uniref:Crp/Fnr family transcriptional regulator n=1 Tax=Catellatospora vulcania TaxID=1460450 RepID=UPI0018AFCC77|nr:Crp/Fnr family transcriptional regulator [Catellatospora vulcania]